MEHPRLIDTTARNYLQNALQSCHENRVKIYYYALNIGVFIAFVCIVGFTLYLCYRNKPTPYEQRQKMIRDQEYVLSKIKYYQSEQKNLMTSPIGQV
jgi:phosphotransferase system  glucose/maltose/N-acetylglucosamine-specific IIC component